MKDAAPQEHWRPIPGYENHYDASDLGSIRSLKRGTPKLLCPTPDDKGYLKVGLYLDGQRRTFPVHLLILLAFRGPRPDGTMGCHFDDVPTNNRLTNLSWSTDNQYDSVANGTHANARKTLCANQHPYAENVQWYRRRNGSMQRQCRRCDTAHQRAYRARRKDEAVQQQPKEVAP